MCTCGLPYKEWSHTKPSDCPPHIQMYQDYTTDMDHCYPYTNQQSKLYKSLLE